MHSLILSKASTRHKNCHVLQMFLFSLKALHCAIFTLKKVLFYKKTLVQFFYFKISGLIQCVICRSFVFLCADIYCDRQGLWAGLPHIAGEYAAIDWDVCESILLPQISSSATLEGKGQLKFTAGKWSPHHNSTQLATANDTAIRGWDLRSMR